MWWGSATVDDPGTTFGLAADVVNGTFQPVAGDFDGDGRTDIYWYGPGTAGDVMWWGTTTRGTWVNQTVTVNGTYASIGAGDFDGDGEDDMFFHSSAAADPVWWGNTRASFGSAGSKNLTIAATVAPVVGDFDGDGKDDLLAYVAGSGADTVWWGAARTAFGTDPAHGGLAAEATTISTYAYGASGQLLSQTTGGVTTSFVWDQTGGSSQLLVQSTPAGTSYVVHGPGGRPIAQIDPGGSVSWLHTDAVGSVVAATDAAGVVTSTQTWDVWGNPTGSTGATQPILGWQGQPTDAATGEVVLNGDGGYPPFYGGDGHYDPSTGTTTAGGTQPGGSHTVRPSLSNPFGIPPGYVPPFATGDGAGGGGGGSIPVQVQAWFDSHGAITATIGAAVICFFASVGWCAAATAIAFVIRTIDRINDDGWEESRDDIAIDALLTLTFFIAGSAMSGMADELAGAHSSGAFNWGWSASEPLKWFGRVISSGFEWIAMVFDDDLRVDAC